MFENRNKTDPQLGKRVFDTGRHFPKVVTGDKAVRFKLTELFCEARFGYSHDAPAQCPEMADLFKGNVVKYFYLPLSAEDLLYCGNGGTAFY